jgi:hypothetical protein
MRRAGKKCEEGSPRMKAGWAQIRQNFNPRISVFGFICVHPVFIRGEISPLWRDKIETMRHYANSVRPGRCFIEWRPMTPI